ncbi:hypothetical protein V2J09_002976 [Rumex salicifolius]
MPMDEQSMKGLLSTWGLGAKPCDSCKSSAALLFCRADSAFLCGACDSKIHAANRLASRHERVWMCEVCEQAPAAVTCKADAAALCTSCDRDIHSANPLARRHERVPVVPFYHTPSDLSVRSSTASVLLAPGDVPQPPSVDTAYADDSWLIPNLQGKLANADFMCSSDIDSFLDSGCPDFDVKIPVNEQQLGNNRSFLFGAGTDSVVPTQTKNRHPNNLYNDSCFEIDFSQSKLSPFNFSAQCISQSVSSSDVGIVPDGNANSISEDSNFSLTKSMSTKSGVVDGGSAAQPLQLSRIDREAKVMRYREKRKNRKFEKTIRYASRKAYAETRPRIKGRFARRTKADADVDQIYADSGVNDVVRGFFIDDMYGVVPSF